LHKSVQQKRAAVVKQQTLNALHQYFRHKRQKSASKDKGFIGIIQNIMHSFSVHDTYKQSCRHDKGRQSRSIADYMHSLCHLRKASTRGSTWKPEIKTREMSLKERNMVVVW